jgi:hypothetical protein
MQPKERLGRVEGRSPRAESVESESSGSEAPSRPSEQAVRPLLMVDIDGVVSLFGPFDAAREGSFHSIEGIPHFLSATAAAHLLDLAALFDLVWASGWEERANEHLPHLLGMPPRLPFLRFDRDVGGRAAHARAHWKLDAIDAYAGARPLAWVDDALDGACHEWAAARQAPTLLVQTAPAHGLTTPEARRLAEWARALGSG